MKGIMKIMTKLSILLPLFLLIGCRSDQLSLERTAISLVAGIDKSEEEGKIGIYQTNPVFSSEATDVVNNLSTTAYSLRKARDQLDSQSSGTIVGGKLQVILLGKELLKERAIFKDLDVFYRDPKNSPNARITLVDGPVLEIVEFQPKDKPRIAVYLSDLIDTTALRENTVLTTLQEFHHDHFEKGITPAFTELKRQGDELLVTGTALLNDEGKYALSVGYLDSSLILMIKRGVKEPIPMSFLVNQPSGVLSVQVNKIKNKMDVTYKGDQLTFDIDLKLKVSITENTSSINLEKDVLKTQKFIEKKIKKHIEELFTKMQKHKLDPFGLGLHVRAHEYKKWKTFEDDWPEEFSKAKVNVKTDVTIIGYGVTN